VQQPNDAEAIAAITTYRAEVTAARQTEGADFEYDGPVVWVNGFAWVLWLNPDGWEAQHVHEEPSGLIVLEVDGSEGERRRVGGPELAPEAIVDLLRSVDRGL
jgi:hypothetical protein